VFADARTGLEHAPTAKERARTAISGTPAPGAGRWSATSGLPMPAAEDLFADASDTPARSDGICFCELSRAG